MLDIKDFDINNEELRHKNSLLICTCGYEERSWSVLKEFSKAKYNPAHICLIKYHGQNDDRHVEMLDYSKENFKSEATTVEYDRFSPSNSEEIVYDSMNFLTKKVSFSRAYIDISTMSKLLIAIFVNLFKDHAIPVAFLYSEPKTYSPSEENFKQNIQQYDSGAITTPSYGVNQVVRTPRLTSLVMAESPRLLVAFTNFNKQLIRALIAELNPERVKLGSSTPPRFPWRKKACDDLHGDLVESYGIALHADAAGSQDSVCTLNPHETFSWLSKIYRDHCCFYQITIAPTGSKMQALAVALFQICCPDVHIEYATPEGFSRDSYSSAEIEKIHIVDFNQPLIDLLINLKDSYDIAY